MRFNLLFLLFLSLTLMPLPSEAGKNKPRKKQSQRQVQNEMNSLVTVNQSDLLDQIPNEILGAIQSQIQSIGDFSNFSNRCSKKLAKRVQNIPSLQTWTALPKLEKFADSISQFKAGPELFLESTEIPAELLLIKILLSWQLEVQLQKLDQFDNPATRITADSLRKLRQVAGQKIVDILKNPPTAPEGVPPQNQENSPYYTIIYPFTSFSIGGFLSKKTKSSLAQDYKKGNLNASARPLFLNSVNSQDISLFDLKSFVKNLAKVSPWSFHIHDLYRNPSLSESDEKALLKQIRNFKSNNKKWKEIYQLSMRKNLSLSAFQSIVSSALQSLNASVQNGRFSSATVELHMNSIENQLLKTVAKLSCHPLMQNPENEDLKTSATNLLTQYYRLLNSADLHFSSFNLSCLDEEPKRQIFDSFNIYSNSFRRGIMSDLVASGLVPEDRRSLVREIYDLFPAEPENPTPNPIARFHLHPEDGKRFAVELSSAVNRNPWLEPTLNHLIDEHVITTDDKIEYLTKFSFWGHQTFRPKELHMAMDLIRDWQIQLPDSTFQILVVSILESQAHSNHSSEKQDILEFILDEIKLKYQGPKKQELLTRILLARPYTTGELALLEKAIKTEIELPNAENLTGPTLNQGLHYREVPLLLLKSLYPQYPIVEQ